MLLNRICKLFLIFLIACAVSSCTVSQAEDGADGVLRSEIDLFLSELNVISSVKNELLASMADNNNIINERTAVVRTADNGVFCLALVKILDDKESDVAKELEIFAQDRALFLARGEISIALGQSNLKNSVKKELYRYNEALGHALFAYYEPRGIQTSSYVLKKTKSGRFAVVLAWLKSDLANTLQDEVLSEKTLDDDYCRFLYLNQARDLFIAGRYSEALPLFKNIHDLKWMDISAYLDAAECFLKIGEPKECLTLVKEIRAELGREMSSLELARAGRLCRGAGDKKAALDSFNHARVRLHEENNKNFFERQ